MSRGAIQKFVLTAVVDVTIGPMKLSAVRFVDVAELKVMSPSLPVFVVWQWRVMDAVAAVGVPAGVTRIFIQELFAAFPLSDTAVT